MPDPDGWSHRAGLTIHNGQAQFVRQSHGEHPYREVLTGTVAADLTLQLSVAFAEFENGIRTARQREEIARARADGGKYQERRPKLSAEQQAELRQRFAAGENRSQLARDFASTA